MNDVRAASAAAIALGGQVKEREQGLVTDGSFVAAFSSIEPQQPEDASALCERQSGVRRFAEHAWVRGRDEALGHPSDHRQPSLQ
mmetsp:Transcript_15227/g.47184  ORF Transcript_15227/g.47184 Transcript_15227/m.47184 type:complete len:85 (+) Transcript_15227:400-654(+)